MRIVIKSRIRFAGFASYVSKCASSRIPCIIDVALSIRTVRFVLLCVSGFNSAHANFFSSMHLDVLPPILAITTFSYSIRFHSYDMVLQKMESHIVRMKSNRMHCLSDDFSSNDFVSHLIKHHSVGRLMLTHCLCSAKDLIVSRG